MKYMNKIIIPAMLCLAFFVFAPARGYAEAKIEIIEKSDIEAGGVLISISQNVLHVSGAEGQTLQIYKITGVGVMSVKIDSEDKYITLDLAKGCYIVKIGKIARKISII